MHWFHNRSLRLKPLLVFGAVLLLMAMLGAFALIQLHIHQ